MNIKMGVPVLAEDGEAGHVEKLIIHPKTDQVDAVVAAQGGLLSHDVIIPMDRVLAADENGLRVRGTVDDIRSLEPFALSQYTVPPEEWIPPTGDGSSFYLFPVSPYTVGAFIPPQPQPGLPEHEVEDLDSDEMEVSGSTEVFCGERRVGKLDRVVTKGDSDRVTHLVLSRGATAVAVPVERVGAIGDDGIQLAMSEEELDRLPDFEE